MQIRFPKAVSSRATALVRLYRLVRYIKSNPVGSLQFYPGMDGKQPKGFELDSNQMAADYDVWVAVAVGMIAKNLSEAPLIVEEMRRMDGKDKWIRDETGDLATMLARPHTREPMMAILWKVVLSLLLHGNGYLIVDRDAGQLFHVNSSWVSVIANDDGETIGYEIRNDRGVTKNLDVEQVIHFKMPNHLAGHYGLSPVKPIRASVLTNYFYERYIKSFFERGAVPGGLLWTEKDLAGDRAEEMKQSAKQEWNKEHAGSQKGHGIAILGSGWKYQTISPPLKDLAVEVLTRVTRERVLAGFGLPPVLAGVYEYANYANSDRQVKIFWQNTVLPIIRLLQETLNLQLVPLYASDDIRKPLIRCRFEIEKILALQEDETEKTNRVNSVWKSTLIKRNEARERLGWGLEPLSPEDGGDDFFTQAAGGFLMPEPESGSKAIAPIRIQAPASGKVSERIRTVHNKFLKSATAVERDLRKFWTGFLDDQMERVIDNIFHASGKGRSMAFLQLRTFPKLNRIIKANIDAVFDPDEESKRLAQELGPYLFELVEREGQAGAERFGISMAFDVTAAPVDEFVNGMVNKIRAPLTDTTWQRIREILAQGENEGWALEKLVQEIRSAPLLFGKDRLKRIVRTEGTTITNGSSTEAWRQGGIPFHTWISAFDDVTRDEHAAANGQTVKINEHFTVGGERAKYPGDYNLSPENRINCRCTSAPAMDPDDWFGDLNE